MLTMGIDRKHIHLEYQEQDSNILVDLAIVPSTPKPNWPFKGIFVEFDGPSHYYAPAGKGGQINHSAFSKHRLELMKNIGF